MRTGLYSRIVAWLKILLPLAALALLSTLFLLSRDTQDAIAPELGARMGGGDTRERVRGPSYAGVTDRGEMITLTAEMARPETDGRIVADTVRAILTLGDGTRIELDAPRAILADTEDEARLEGGVEITSTNGYRLRTEGMVATLDGVGGRTLGPVEGEAPAGTLEAGALAIEPGDAPDAVQLLFTEGVKMIYVPKSRSEAP
jgi:lipopolysaccharide export system protein LptC